MVNCVFEGYRGQNSVLGATDMLLKCLCSVSWQTSQPVVQGKHYVSEIQKALHPISLHEMPDLLHRTICKDLCGILEQTSGILKYLKGDLMRHLAPL